jgi:hypothetical protein
VALPRLVVRMDDGREFIVSTGRPSVLLAFERRFGRQDPQGVWEVCWMAYRGIEGHPPEDEGEPFERWIDTVAELDFQIDQAAEIEQVQLGNGSGATPSVPDPVPVS